MSEEFYETELGSIPRGWNVKTLGQLGAEVTSGSRGWAKYYSEHGELFIRITNMRRSSTKLDLADPKFVHLPTDDAEGARTRLQTGDLLISITADIGIVALVDDEVPSPAYINQHIARVRLPRDSVDSAFIAYYLASWLPQRRFLAATDTGAKAGMNLPGVAAVKVVVPPLSEQRRIAKALGDADAELRALAELAGKKRLLRMGLLQQLLSGRTRIEGFTSTWEDVTLEEVCDLVRSKREPAGVPGKTIVVEMEHVEPRTGRLLGVGTADRSTSAKTMFEVNDVLFGKLRSYLRKYWLADRPGLCSTEFWALRAKPSCLPTLLRYLVETDPVVDAASGGTGTHMPRADWQIVRRASVPLPPIDEQRAISAVLADADAELEGLHRRLEKARNLRASLMQELLTGRTRLPEDAAA